MHLGKVIHDLCTKHKVPQNELAKAVNKSPSAVSNWIAGRFPPSAPDIINICFFFHGYKEKHNKTLIKLMDAFYRDMEERKCE